MRQSLLRGVGGAVSIAVVGALLVGSAGASVAEPNRSSAAEGVLAQRAGKDRATSVTGWSTRKRTLEVGESVTERVRVRSGDGFRRRTVLVQRRRASHGDHWRTAARKHTNRAGRLTVALTAGTGAWRFRLRVRARRGFRSAVTATRRLTITDPGRTIDSGRIVVVSARSDGVIGNRASRDPRVSPDGSRVLFASNASNLVSDDLNDSSDLFVKDLKTGRLTLVSATPDGRPGNGASSGGSWSPDGSAVLFASRASDLVPGDANGRGDLFVRDMATDETTVVSADASGRPGNNVSRLGSWAPDSTQVAFLSDATDLTPDPPASGGSRGVVYVKSLRSAEVTRVATTTLWSEAVAWSPDGHAIYLRGSAHQDPTMDCTTPLDPEDTYTDPCSHTALLRHTFATGDSAATTRAIACARLFMAGSGPSGCSAHDLRPSPDGGFVLFRSTYDCYHCGQVFELIPAQGGTPREICYYGTGGEGYMYPASCSVSLWHGSSRFAMSFLRCDSDGSAAVSMMDAGSGAITPVRAPLPAGEPASLGGWHGDSLLLSTGLYPYEHYDPYDGCAADSPPYQAHTHQVRSVTLGGVVTVWSRSRSGVLGNGDSVDPQWWDGGVVFTSAATNLTSDLTQVDQILAKYRP